VSRLPLLDAKDLERLLFRLGFEKTRQKGSHSFYRHLDGRTTTLPHHAGRMISRPLLREILREIDLKVEDYLKMIGEL